MSLLPSHEMDRLKPLRIVIMASGKGTTFTAIHRAIQEKMLNAELVVFTTIRLMLANML